MKNLEQIINILANKISGDRKDLLPIYGLYFGLKFVAEEIINYFK